MKIKFSFIVIIFLLFITSCSESTNQNNPIFFDLNNNENILFTEVFDSVSYLALETNNECLFGNIQKMKYSNNRYYLLTGYSNEKIIVFDKKSGKHELTINKTGKGPGEYIMASDFYVDKEDRYIDVYSRGLRKIISYDKHGVFIREKKFDININSFTKINNDYYLDANIPEKGNALLFVPDKESNYEILYDLQDLSIAFGDKNNFSVIGNTVSFARSVFNNIYHINGKNCYVKYNYSFNEHTIPQNFLNRNFEHFSSFSKMIKQNNYAHNNFFNSESENFIISSIVYKSKMHLAIFCKSTGHSKIANTFVDNIHNFHKKFNIKRGFIPLSLENDILIFKFESSAINSLIKKETDSTNYRIFGQLKGVQSDDNPVLMKCKLKIF